MDKKIINLCIIGSRGYLGYQLISYLKEKYKNIKLYLVFKKKIDNNIKKKISASDLIFFLAGPSNKNINLKNYNTRYHYIKKIFLLKKKKKFKIIYFSTIKTKRLISNYPLNEKLYIKSHKNSEIFLKNKKQAVIVRLSNIFGLNYNYLYKNLKASPMNIFIKKLFKKESIILKKPKDKRDFVTLIQFFKLIDLLIKKNYSKREVNLANNYFLTIENFIKLIKNIITKNSNQIIKHKNKHFKLYKNQILKTIEVLKF